MNRAAALACGLACHLSPPSPGHRAVPHRHQVELPALVGSWGLSAVLNLRSQLRVEPKEPVNQVLQLVGIDVTVPPEGGLRCGRSASTAASSRRHRRAVGSVCPGRNRLGDHRTLHRPTRSRPRHWPLPPGRRRPSPGCRCRRALAAGAPGLAKLAAFVLVLASPHPASWLVSNANRRQASLHRAGPAHNLRRVNLVDGRARAAGRKEQVRSGVPTGGLVAPAVVVPLEDWVPERGHRPWPREWWEMRAPA